MSFRGVGIGEVLWDLLPGGRRPGGAPANFACHLAGLGAGAALVSRVGDDEPGRTLLGELARRGVHTSAIAVDASAPTGTVVVALEQGQPRYRILEEVAWDHLEVDAAALAAVRAADAVCFGSLAQRRAPARDTVHALLRQAPPAALRVFDVNLRPGYHAPEILEASLRAANAVKLNEDELPVLAAQWGLPGEERRAIVALAERFALRALAFTRGDRGSLVIVGSEMAEQPALPVRVADTVGAGDAFTAAFTLGVLAGWPAGVVAARATAVAAFVCTRPGATPELPADLRAPFAAP